MQIYSEDCMVLSCLPQGAPDTCGITSCSVSYTWESWRNYLIKYWTLLIEGRMRGNKRDKLLIYVSGWADTLPWHYYRTLVWHLTNMKIACTKHLSLLLVVSYLSWGTDCTVLLCLYRSFFIQVKLSLSTLFFRNLPHIRILSSIHHAWVRLTTLDSNHDVHLIVLETSKWMILCRTHGRHVLLGSCLCFYWWHWTSRLCGSRSKVVLLSAPPL